jgi:F0F1-type ATP synthase membrane subunit b/b'
MDQVKEEFKKLLQELACRTAQEAKAEIERAREELKTHIETKVREVSIISSKAASEAKDEAIRTSSDMFVLLKYKNDEQFT